MEGVVKPLSSSLAPAHQRGECSGGRRVPGPVADTAPARMEGTFGRTESDLCPFPSARPAPFLGRGDP